MKFSFVLFLLLDIPHLKGQQRTEEFEHILLRFTFPSFYNSYLKTCCKLYPGGCYTLLDSTGYTCDLLKGRVTKTENDGWIEFKISNVSFADGGFYRCIVLGTQNRVYNDYYVEVSAVSSHNSQSQPSQTTTIKAPNTSTKLPHSTEAVLAEDHSESRRVPWSFGLSLAVIVSITAMFLITSVIGVVCCRVKAKQADKHGETPCESLKQEAPEISGIVYTTVDFRAHQKPSEVYANLKTYKTQMGDPDSTWSTELDGMVEYSTLAIHK
ncbi:hypothetical protein D5F01_LYC08504 [Larimichthys crocea]|uniref:Immunoglobulin V-set domain-containing protein n=2 Tax=Larimichthys crocea TaxID=215358 RepID=A0A6G0IQ31_LARCR|nr:hypothetical protein D5F01_LYC08504 [Larimichthys crocea]TMS16827.1 hypothetical protein E3U43_014120 [Larimichthys crocea]